MHPAVSAIARKVRRMKQVVKETCVELWSDAFLALSPERRKALLAAYQTAKANDELYEFAVAHFGPHQIKGEILAFLDFARNRKPQRVCEIGVANGGTNFLLTHALGADAEMIGIDLLLKNKGKLRLFQDANRQVTLLRGSSSNAEMIERVRTALRGELLDLIFIDGDHSYEGVKADFLAYSPLVRPGGMIAFHDIVQDHRARFGSNTPGWAGGVPQFWQEIKAGRTTFEFVADAGQDGCGIGVIVTDSPAQT
jgi:predicted O-methyltransferase YrrM